MIHLKNIPKSVKIRTIVRHSQYLSGQQIYWPSESTSRKRSSQSAIVRHFEENTHKLWLIEKYVNFNTLQVFSEFTEFPTVYCSGPANTKVARNALMGTLP